MEEKHYDILADKEIHSTPFVMPDGYVPSLEEKIHERIHREPLRLSLFLFKAKAPAMLALTFAIIFGMGYAVMHLTGTSDKEGPRINDIPQMLVNYNLPSSFIEEYYDEINYEASLSQSLTNMEISADMEFFIINSITIDDIIENFGNEISETNLQP